MQFWVTLCEASVVLLATVSLVIAVVLTVSMALPIISLIAFTLDKIKPLGDDNRISELGQPTVSDFKVQPACCRAGKGRWITPGITMTDLAYFMAFVCFCIYYGLRRLSASSNPLGKRERTRDHVLAWQVAWKQSKDEANAQRGNVIGRR